jgi:hypothetical protein
MAASIHDSVYEALSGYGWSVRASDVRLVSISGALDSGVAVGSAVAGRVGVGSSGAGVGFGEGVLV